jgi:MFS family permease
VHKFSRNIIILAIGQALTSTAVSLLTSVSSLSGAYLAPRLSLSTLPVTATIFGTLLAIYPASSLMGSLGRRNGFMLKAGLGILGGIFCYFSLIFLNFSLLIFGAFLLGIFSAFGQYYRFAAIDAVNNRDDRAMAISVVTGAGVIGGIMGPFLASHFATIIPSAPYAGAFIALSIVCIFLAISQIFLTADLGRRNPSRPTPVLSMTHTKLESNFIKATMICAIGFAIMTLTMNAAPLALKNHGFDLGTASIVLQVHFTFMYLPSFFNPFLVKRLGIKKFIALGIASSLAGSLLTLIHQQTLLIYILELGLSGIGWNFMFNGGTILLADTYHPTIKSQAQGLNSIFVYSANMIASFSAGALMTFYGWSIVNLVCLPLLIITTLILWNKNKGFCPQEAYTKIHLK